MANSAIEGMLDEKIKKRICDNLVKLKQSTDSNIKWTKRAEKLFWILCEYDHAHAPSNWEEEYYHEKYTFEWTEWIFQEKKYNSTEDAPYEKCFIDQIIDLSEKEDNLERAVSQWGIISEMLFDPFNRYMN